jgi:hypothetical protein
LRSFWKKDDVTPKLRFLGIKKTFSASEAVKNSSTFLFCIDVFVCVAT